MVIKGRVLVLVTAALVVTMLLAACQPAASTETEGTTVKGEVTTPTTTPTTTTPTTTTPTTTEPEVDYTTTPYYGGVGTFSTSRAGILGQWDPGYLMHRPFHASAYLEGLTQGQAQAAIVRGFLDTSIMGLPETLQEEVDKAITSCEKEVF